MRLKGQRPKGIAGGAAGDLLITFNVLNDKFYKRDGLDLVASVPINIAQATLGSRVSIKTLGGRKVAVRIPAGTGSGKRFRISGQGVEKDGKRGDLYVEIAIAVLLPAHRFMIDNGGHGAEQPGKSDEDIWQAMAPAVQDKNEVVSHKQHLN